MNRLEFPERFRNSSRSEACNWKRCRSRSSIRKSASAQPLDEQLVQPVGRIQRDPVAGAVDLLVAPGSF